MANVCISVPPCCTFTVCPRLQQIFKLCLLTCIPISLLINNIITGCLQLTGQSNTLGAGMTILRELMDICQDIMPSN